jgi:hypothetical protein
MPNLDDFLLAQLEHIYTIFQSENEILVERKNFQILFMENTRVLFFCITRMCISNVEILPNNS